MSISKFVVITFPDESKAAEGVRALKELHSNGAIALYGHAVIERDAKGTLSIKQKAGEGPLGVGVGALVGGLLGLFGGPMGAAVGVAGGGLLGGFRDLFNLGVGEEFVAAVSKDLTAGKFAIVAEISEDWVSPLDTRMGTLGATVLREEREDVIDDEIQRNADARKAEKARLKAERDREKAEKIQAKLSTRIAETEEKLKRIAEKARTRLDHEKQEADAKIMALQEQATKLQPDAKRQIEERIAEMRADHDQRQGKIQKAWDLTQEALRM